MTGQVKAWPKVKIAPIRLIGDLDRASISCKHQLCQCVSQGMNKMSYEI